MDKTNLIEFKTYRFPGRMFWITKQDLRKFRQLEKELIDKEVELYNLIKDKEVGVEGLNETRGNF